MKEIKAYIRRDEVNQVVVSEVVDAIRISDGLRGEPALTGIRPSGAGSAARPQAIA